MNALTKEESTALTLPQRAAVALGTAEYEIKLHELLTNSANILTVTNKAGRDECHAAYMVLKNTRCSITNLADDATEDAKAFTKAVKAEALRLLAITEAEEARLQGLRDAFDEQIAAEKAAKIAAERARVEEINDRIESIREHELMSVRATRTNADFAERIAHLENFDVSSEVFQERQAEAEALKADVLASMRETLAVRVEQARIAAEAEQARIAEAARLESERAELARQRAENERIANEQAAERKRLDDLAAAQALAAQQLADKAAANLRAEQDALAERERIANEAQARAAAELRAAQEKHAAEVAAHAAAVQREADHPEALEMNAQFDAEAAKQQEIDYVSSVLDAGLALPEAATVSDALIDAVPPFLAQRVTTLQAAVRDLKEFGYTDDGVLAIVKAELLAA